MIKVGKPSRKLDELQRTDDDNSWIQSGKRTTKDRDRR